MQTGPTNVNTHAGQQAAQDTRRAWRGGSPTHHGDKTVTQAHVETSLTRPRLIQRAHHKAKAVLSNAVMHAPLGQHRVPTSVHHSR